MGISELKIKYFPLIKKNWFPLVLGSLGLTLFVYGLIASFMANKSASGNIVFDSIKQESSETKTIAVDIEGSVVKPGVYKLKTDSRIQDGLIAAGGLSAQADRNYIAKNLNLATKLSDGAKVYIPKIGEAAGNSSLPNTSSGQTVSGLININSASESELDSLSGVGPVTAQKIISARPYSSIEDLLNKKIVSSKVFNQIKDKINVY
jgi:competence protein ComEA